jgi:hypothetical protein
VHRGGKSIISSDPVIIEEKKPYGRWDQVRREGKRGERGVGENVGRRLSLLPVISGTVLYWPL